MVSADMWTPAVRGQAGEGVSALAAGPFLAERKSRPSEGEKEKGERGAGPGKGIGPRGLGRGARGLGPELGQIPGR